MSLPIYVDAHSGYKANERLRRFTLDEVVYEIDAVLDQWYEPSATYFKVRSTKGKFICSDTPDTMKGQTTGHYRAALTAMNCWRDQALNSSQSILQLQRRPNSRLNRLNTVTCRRRHPVRLAFS